MEKLLILLTLTVITPGEEPNLQRRFEVATIDKCWEAARKWVEQDPEEFGGVALSATCASGKRPADEQPEEKDL